MDGNRKGQNLVKTSWPIACVLITLIIAAAFLLYQCSPKRLVDAGKEATGHALDSAKRIVQEFNHENITTTFTERLTDISESNGALLEVAKIESFEEFHRSSRNWRGTTTTSVRVPVVFKYDISLKEAWKIEIRESEASNICLVVAPKIKPSLPVPILTHRMEKKSEEGWLRWDAEEELNALNREITPQLNVRARKNSKLARDKARYSVADFVRSWLLQADHWRQDRFSIIQVIFKDEFDKNQELKDIELEPTIQLIKSN